MCVRTGGADWATVMIHQALHHVSDPLDTDLAAYLDAVAALRPEDSRELLALAHTAAGLGLPEDAVELLARYVAAAAHEARGDRPALAWVLPALDRMPWLAESDHTLWQALEAVRAIDALPLPQDMVIAPERVLLPNVWERFVEISRGYPRVGDATSDVV